MVIAKQITKRGIIILSILIIWFTGSQVAMGQTPAYNYFYRVYFIDKGNYDPVNFSPGDLLSQRAIQRRVKAGINVPVYSDLPVYPVYINAITQLGYKLHCTSKWMNTGLFKTTDAQDINILKNLPYVKEVRLVKKPVAKSGYTDKLNFDATSADIPPFDRPITMLNGYSLHNSGSDGSGILIAILDGGFINANILSSLAKVRARSGIIGTYDFVSNDAFVYGYHNHGTAVLTVIGGEIPFYLQGTAPGADFWLLRTEDVSSEFPVEEDFWAAGAEFADSAGADIISSSLGYYNFDDPLMNYKFSDMDGNTTFVTQAADFAAAKGILVVNSAGNERNKSWVRIIAPSDGNNIVAAGAVDGYSAISAFSSAGPSADGRVKPDNTTQGVSVSVQTIENSVSRANGTSFSCPVLSGMCACVMQSVPKATNINIINSLHMSGDRAASPDSLFGYGIPDMVEVVSRLQEQLVSIPESESVIGPNPFTGDIEITFKQIPAFLTLEIITLSGEVVVKRNYEEYISRTLRISDLRNREQGIYFVRLITENGTFTHKVIKLKN